MARSFFCIFIFLTLVIFYFFFFSPQALEEGFSGKAKPGDGKSGQLFLMTQDKTLGAAFSSFHLSSLFVVPLSLSQLFLCFFFPFFPFFYHSSIFHSD